MKHIKTFENFEYKQENNIEFDNKIDEGFLDSFGKSDFAKVLTRLYQRENITITKQQVNEIFELVSKLKKEGKIKQIIANGLNRAKKGEFLNCKIGDFNDLYYNNDAKGSGAGLKG